MPMNCSNQFHERNLMRLGRQGQLVEFEFMFVKEKDSNGGGTGR